MKITTINYGRSVLPESMIFKGGDKEKTLPITFTVYLIQEDGRSILVDAGCETMPGFEMTDFCGPIKALESIGISPSDITDLIITHAHHDHIECAKYYKNAVVYIQQDEFEKGSRYLDENKNVTVFGDEQKICKNVTAIKIGGHSNGSCIVEIKHSDKTYIISGDECYLRECIDKKIPTGASKNPEKSKAFIEKYCDEKYKILYCHDSDNN